MSAYWAFLVRPTALDPVAVVGVDVTAPLGDAVRDEILPRLLAFLCLFLGVGLALPPLLRAVWPAFRSLDARTQRNAGVYASAALHHLYVVPASIALIWRDWSVGVVDPISAVLLAPWTAAYLLSDGVLSAVPDCLQGNPLMLVHHALGLYLVSAMLVCSAPTARWFPHMLVTEVSTLFLEASWALGKAGKEGSPLHLAVNVGFAASFLLSRIVNLPMMLAALWLHHQEELLSLGPAHWTLEPLVVMQAFWAAKIVQMVLKLLLGEGAGGKAAGPGRDALQGAEKAGTAGSSGESTLSAASSTSDGDCQAAVPAGGPAAVPSHAQVPLSSQYDLPRLRSRAST